MHHPVTLPAPASLRVGLNEKTLIHDKDRLSFSWSLPFGGYQTAYRLTVTSGTVGALAFDSGWMASSQSIAVTPEGLGECLQADRLYTWRVTLRVRPSGETTVYETPVSAPSVFVTAPEPTQAVGLWAGDSLFSYLRREFTLTEATAAHMSRAVLMVTAASPEPTRQYVYRAYINDQCVGLGPSRLDKSPEGQTLLYYQSFDVTSLLQSGLNCLGAVCYATEGKAFFCRLTIYDSAGCPSVICTTDEPELWQALSGDEIYRPDQSIGTHYYIAHACHIDGTHYPHGFSKVGFDALAWQVPTVKEDMAAYRLAPSPTAPLREFPSPADTVKVTQTDTGSYLIDLGREIVGGFRLTLPSPTTAEITLVYGEELTPEGHVLCPMRTGNAYRETWRLTPEGAPLSTLTLMTYRYIEISGGPVEITPDTVQGLEIRADFDESRATFTCDHPLLSRLWALVKHTVKVTTQDLYVDSQSRERTAYEGDLYINLLAAYACGSDPSVGRFTMQYLCSHRTWPAEYPLFVILSAWADYVATGDISFLKSYAPVLERMVFTEHLSRAVGLIASPDTRPSLMNSVLVDWPASERDGYDMAVTYNTVFNALCVRAYGTLSNIFTVLGDVTKAKGYAKLAKSIMRAMIVRLYDPADGCFFDGCDAHTGSPHKSQHATAFCLACGIYDSPLMKNRMAAFLERQGEIRMSVYGAYFLLEGLYTSGHGDIANRLMLSDDTTEGARTWAYMLDGLGATVTTEAWNRKNKPNMTYSHPWGAAPAHMISAGIFGITPTAPGYETFDLRLCPPDGMTRASYTLTTARGRIAVAFDAASSVCQVSVPFNTTACLHLPDGHGEREVVLEAGEQEIML